MTRTRTINGFEIFVLTSPGLWYKVYTLVCLKVEIVSNIWGSRDSDLSSWLKSKRGMFIIINEIWQYRVSVQIIFVEIGLSLSPNSTFLYVGLFFQFGRGGHHIPSLHTNISLARWPPLLLPHVKRAYFPEISIKSPGNLSLVWFKSHAYPWINDMAIGIQCSDWPKAAHSSHKGKSGCSYQKKGKEIQGRLKWFFSYRPL